MKINQLSLFEKEINLKSRGHIETEKIWTLLDIHSKINIRNNGYCQTEPSPNYFIIDKAFKNGFDISPFVLELSKKHYTFMQAQIRKIKPI